MRDDKEMNVQINEYQKLLEYLKAKGMSLLEEFAAGVLIEKFPDSWSDYKKNLKHKQKNFTNGKIVTDILIEDSNRKESAKASMAALKENSVESSSSNRKRYKNKSQGHHASHYKYRAGNDKKTNTPKANLVDGADIIVVVISQVNIIVHAKEWVVHSGATRHICANREVFSSYTPLEDDREERLFVLNVSDVINGNASVFAYMVESISLWHARLGETLLLSLIHTDLDDLKQTMSRGGKRYYVTFIDNLSTYTKLYLLRNKDDAFNAFISYKTEVENQLSRKLKRIRSDRGREYLSLNDFCKKEGIIHEVTPPYLHASNGVAGKK
ncbi:uncharacterized protein LOC107771575 [Nicotiana tabacum]|uniref:Uncharacterized protein LOC107771575 n=1 Tax=Nicotiana tabacum TaxID=4097 RepID=A0AC58S625_TOBAC